MQTQTQPATYDVSQFKNNYFLSCSKEASSGADALPSDLAMSICSCEAASIVSAYGAQQLQAMESDIAANYQMLSQHAEACANSELPKYAESHPEFVRQYIQQHPEVLQ